MKHVRTFLWPIVFLFMLLMSVVSTVYFYTQYQRTKAQLAQTPQQAQEEAKQLVGKIGQLIVLPQGEEPTLATVTDTEKLASQPFFTSARNGDKVLVYTQARKAILYRPSDHIIVDVASISVSSPSASAPSESPSAPVRFVLYNGTATTGLTRVYETTLKQRVPAHVIVDRDNAKSREYETTLLIDLTGSQLAKATELATKLGIEIGSLPAGEERPEGADFLIILGKDRQ
jgi:hypothetical protein